MKLKFYSKRKAIHLALIFVLMGLVSCYDNDDDNQSLDNKSTNNVESLYDRESNLKREFGKALIGAMKQSKALRELLKTEALKMFDKDYDVLYLLIKDKQLENSSVEEIIAKHLGGKQKLNDIISQNPTLTILVPELPNNSFSAKLWDTENDIPAIAIRTNTSNGVPYITASGTEDVIPAQYTPAFPILVLKDNERVIVSNSSAIGNSGLNKTQTRAIYNENGVTLKFWHNAFDNSIKQVERKRIYINGGISPKAIEAHDIYKHTDGWQRDYIYYGISPSNPNGHYRYDHKEHITSFSMAGDARSVLGKISDQTGEPDIRSTPINGSSWTDGYFDFKVITNINSKNGPGNQIINGFTASPSDLFDVEYEFIYIPFTNTSLAYVKDVHLRNMNVNLPLFNWNLEDIASTIKISVQEVDLTETFTQTQSRTVQFASNFEINPTLGFLEKIGLKFGAKLSETRVGTNKVTFTKGGDFLGEVIINFADDVIIGKNNFTYDGDVHTMYTTREYSTGYCKFSIEPKKVQ